MSSVPCAWKTGAMAIRSSVRPPAGRFIAVTPTGTLDLDCVRPGADFKKGHERLLAAS